MKKISNEIKLSELDHNGEYLFVYSDKYNIFLFFLDIEDYKLYKITTDKYLNIEYIDEIITPTDFNSFKTIKFFKPFNTNNNEYNFIGIIEFENISYKFKINENNVLSYTEEFNHIYKEGIINNVLNLTNIKIFNYIQKKNRIFLVGYDPKYNDYIYAIYNLEDNKFEKVYSLYSDYGDIIPMSLNIDTDERKVYIVGKCSYYNENNKFINSVPYFEIFLLN